MWFKNTLKQLENIVEYLILGWKVTFLIIKTMKETTKHR